MLTRRDFLATTSAVTLAAWGSRLSADEKSVRSYHVCLAADVIAKTPEILKTVHDAGCSHVWIAGFFYGHWPYSKDMLRSCKEKIEQAGMSAQAINVPLGHPGDSLGASDGTF